MDRGKLFHSRAISFWTRIISQTTKFFQLFKFLAATIETKGHIGAEEFASAFDHLDFDKNGYISTSVSCLCFSRLCCSAISSVSFIPLGLALFKDLRVIIGRDLPQSTIDQIIDESDIIGDHKIWKDEFLALEHESTEDIANDNIDHDSRHRRQIRCVYLKRSRSADDFDLVKTRSLEGMYSDSEVSLAGNDQFRIEKAKSVRKATKFS